MANLPTLVVLLAGLGLTDASGCALDDVNAQITRFGYFGGGGQITGGRGVAPAPLITRHFLFPFFLVEHGEIQARHLLLRSRARRSQEGAVRSGR